ncbi:MAG TPA: HAMP domain-containing sensor histidine kinase [Vicinamibacterales bacterium]|nr:HAMP domain-containing sensor histidine kinase [Vicinamibacterales bacterium]
MRRQFRVPMAIIAGGLLGLIALLATLQYKWLGQISGAERERMKASLHDRATAFAQDVDRELTRAYLLFQLDSLDPEQGAAAAVAGRYDRWLATSRFPRIVKDVYIVPQAAPGDTLTLQHYNPATRFVEPAEWPDAAAPIRKQMEQPPPPVSGAAGPALLLRAMVPAVWPAVPALVVQSPMLMVSHIDARLSEMRGIPARLAPGIRHTVLMLDAEYMKNEMLPALAQQHFNRTGVGFEYQLAVLPAQGEAPLYRSTREFSPGADAKVDATVELFQVRARDFEPLAAEVSRFTALSASPRSNPSQRTHTIYRETIGQSPAGAAGGAPFSIVVQGSPGQSSQRGDRLFAAGATTFSTRVSVPSPSYWRLLVKHPSGSLETAVNAARRRNLAISSGILGVLGLSVAFLIVSTRRAHDLARQQLEFVATVSHELRTPLAVIRSAADNLADGVVSDEARIRQYGQLVRREGLRLTDLVEQILEFAGLQSGQRGMTARPVEIDRVLREVAATAEATAPPGLRVEIAVADGLPPVPGDEAALRRVFQNLVGNAIKYGAEAGWIGITATRTASTVEISVSDRGIGIAAADHARIFDPFYRAPGVVAAQIQGAGLGLSLVKRIVEAHAGRITLKSAPGQGSTFTVSLPAFRGDAADGHDRVADAAPQTS